MSNKQLIKNNVIVIIPALNEERNIGKVIDDIYANNNNVDIVVINDGSWDKTAENLKSKNVFVITHPYNMGIGASFETGCQFALQHGYEYLVRIDGDGQHDSKFIKDLLEPVKTDIVDIAIGSRFLGNSEFKSSSGRLIGIWIISAVLSIISGKRVTDPTSGFCVMNRKAFEFFSKNCPDDYPEPEILVYHRNFRIEEFPISIERRNSGTSSITPLKSIYYMFKVLLSLFVHVFRKEIK